MSTASISDKAELLVRYFMNIRLNKVAELKEILSLDASVVHAISRDGFNGLQLACKYGFVDVTEVLLAGGICVTTVDAKYGRTFLHWASINGHNEVISFLVRDHCESLSTVIDLADTSGHTALMHAVKGGRVGIVRLLLAAGASLANTIQSGAVVKTVFDLCNKSEELVKILRQEETRRAESTDVVTSMGTGTEVKSNVLWGLSGTTHLSQHSQTRKKCIELGWLQANSKHASQEDGATKKSKIQDAIVKLNRDDRELQAELDIRTVLNTPIVAPATTTADSFTCITNPAEYSNPHIVQLLHSDVVRCTDKGGTWHGILLEKGLLDLHHLCDYMHQNTTHSRLHDLRWKVEQIVQLNTICMELSSRDIVWYDLKPSNFIVFPVSEVINGEVCSNKLHHWLQHSTWDSDTFSFKAADLSSVYTVGGEVDITLISCTAKYIHPSVATIMSQKDCHTVVCSQNHMMWSYGMTMLQLLHRENKTLFAHYEVTNSEQVYSFLTQDPSLLQGMVYNYIQILVEQQCKDVSTAVCAAMCNVLKNMLTVEGCATFVDVKMELERILTLL